jgi:NAD(P)-dependent dehydrogenase (short-subunit alcohol dehydrogenase family)
MNKVVLVTGASSGLGRALATALAEKGYKVYGASRNPQGIEPFIQLRMDVQDDDSVVAAVKEILDKAGRIDILINNAGIGIAGPLEQLSMANIQRVFDTNVYGLIRVSQAVLPTLRQIGGGRIINISSIAAEVALPYRAVYSASKAAVDRLTEALRLEVERFGVEVCAIQAGDIRTAINDHRIMEYDEQDPAYNLVFAQVAKKMNESVDQGVPAEEMAAKIIEIMEKRRLKKLYPVGKPYQKLSIYLRRFLPASLFEFIIRSYTKA